jgi:hypothetical protein
VTARKGFKPKGAAVGIDDDEWFEQIALGELRRLSTITWNSAVALWRNLPAIHPSTRRRILVRAFQLCAQRHEASPARLLNALDAELLAARNRGETRRGRPASKRRIDLCRDLRAGAENAKPPSAHLLALLSLELCVSSTPRSRATDPDKIREAARLHVHGHSISEIARKLGMPGRKATVHGFTKRAEFKKEAADERSRVKLGRSPEKEN